MGGKQFFCENVAFEPPNLENVAFEPPKFKPPDTFEIEKVLDFVYTNPSQASHLDAKKKTKTKVFWKKDTPVERNNV